MSRDTPRPTPRSPPGRDHQGIPMSWDSPFACPEAGHLRARPGHRPL